jgi:hypothetical protein
MPANANMKAPLLHVKIADPHGLPSMHEINQTSLAAVKSLVIDATNVTVTKTAAGEFTLTVTP